MWQLLQFLMALLVLLLLGQLNGNAAQISFRMLKMNRALDSMEVLAQTGTDLLQEQFALMDYWNQ